ncbi:PPR domain-containing protein/PPR_2 domain-containing protein/PPR_3 domain-containing protein [Cephalotus follicularis]|uniref:PPR domain-containing protein/PPR_2 domain-containing protein/PPR_3 domain-containing protein n=1 Tax=Cephalotus follicularis TaxID=3775 RepID=A0A1Q3BJD2_CEPFO|nr:PPR domain-containing protein/PPR_2 domain-containing protein/PPR_3 domain-containing protein [Cephalotus follicularis]
MAATLSTAIDVHFTGPKTDTKRPIFFTKHQRHSPTRRRFTIYCNSLSKSPLKSPQNLSESTNPKNPSLSDQLKPLSATTLPTTTKEQTHLLSNPKSIWVNPARPKRSVISLQRHKRSLYSYNPNVRELRLFAQKLNNCEDTESAFLAVLEEIPHPPTRENALLILNSLKPWQKAHLFFNWIKTQNLFPMETIFYNVTMKSLRFGRQFQLIEELANEMVSNEIVLDNITYSTIITCAKRCNLFDKAVEWFERMYKTGLMPDEVTYSAILDVYAKLGKVEDVLSLYERGVASGWRPDPIAFSVLGKMFGENGDYDGIRYVLQEMKSLGVQPNLVLYNTLLEAMGKAGKPGLARTLFDEMVDSGLTPNEKTLTALIKIYGKAKWAKDAMQLWERMRSNKWPMDFILNNTLLNMCADIGLEEEAEKLFEDMKVSENSRPDSWSYTAMLNIYGSGGKVHKAIELFEEMTDLGFELNVMGCTCLIQCFAKARRFDDLVRVFGVAVEQGVKPDDRLCGCLLSAVSLCEEGEDVEKVLACLHQANPELVAFVKLIQEEGSSFETVKEGFRSVISNSLDDARRPFCNCLIDICRNRNLPERAHELLYLGTVYGLYPSLHNRTAAEWSLDVRSLSIGAAHTALEEWMGTLAKIVRRQEALPELFLARTGTGTHKFAQGMTSAVASHLEKLAAPFSQSEERAGCFVATRDDLVLWVHSRTPSTVV